MRIPFSLQLALLTPILSAQHEGPTSGRLREVRITNGDVFDDRTAMDSGLAGLINSLHWQTRKEVVAREVWMQPGETITKAQAAELERNLRSLGLFAEVEVRLVPTSLQDFVDLEVETHDRLTLSFGAGASYVGGVTGFRAAIGESNLFGFGNRLAGSFARNSEGEFRGSVAYSDLHVLDSWHTGTVRVSRTDDGDSIGLDVRRPFKHLADPFGYGFAASHDDNAIEYFRGGDSVAEIQTRTASLAADATWATGPEDRRRFTGFVPNVESNDYSPATGPLAPEFRTPGNTESLFAGVTARWSLIDGYREVEGIDTIDYVQDLTLGLFFGGTAGLRWRDQIGVGPSIQPEIAVHASWAAEPLEDVFAKVSARGTIRYDDSEAVGWNTNLSTWLFAMTGSSNTLGTSATFDAAEETQDLPIELTLGEDNGLRGYLARQFAGTRRIRLNVEDRYDTGLSFATFRVGAVAFFDAGWVGEDGNLGKAYKSAGVGLRIGSKPLLGDGLLRIDLAKPLDDVLGENDSWKLSVSVGQVFTFGGNANTLSAR